MVGEGNCENCYNRFVNRLEDEIQFFKWKFQGNMFFIQFAKLFYKYKIQFSNKIELKVDVRKSSAQALGDLNRRSLHVIRVMLILLLSHSSTSPAQHTNNYSPTLLPHPLVDIVITVNGCGTEAEVGKDEKMNRRREEKTDQFTFV